MISLCYQRLSRIFGNARSNSKAGRTRNNTAGSASRVTGKNLRTWTKCSQCNPGPTFTKAEKS